MFTIISAHTENLNYSSREQSFLGILLSLMSCTKVLLLSWERINSERNKEEVKEAFRKKKQQCSESKI
jgi:hypothetical protein